MNNAKRFVNFHDGRGVMDTQMDPRVLAAQEEAEARKQTRKRSAPVKAGFSEPSEDEMRRKREES